MFGISRSTLFRTLKVLKQQPCAGMTGRSDKEIVLVADLFEAIPAALDADPSDRPPTPGPATQGFETLISRLFRDGLQFCSGLVDLVECVSRHFGGSDRFAFMGE